MYRHEVFQTYLQGKIAECQTKMQMLTMDDCQDEAVFAKIEGNIYEAFLAVFSAAKKIGKGDEEETKRFFREKLMQIPRNWEMALECAERNSENGKAHVERIKLEAANAVRMEFERIWEGKE